MMDKNNMPIDAYCSEDFFVVIIQQNMAYHIK
jgi:hypothetical protein